MKRRMTTRTERAVNRKMLIEGQDYFVRVLPFPNCAVDGSVVSNHDGTASIYINSRVCQKRQEEALEHELEHLANDDLYSEDPVELIEGRMTV